MTFRGLKLLSLLTLLTGWSASAAPARIVPPKGVEAARATDFVEQVYKSTGAGINAVGDRVGYKDGQKVPNNTWQCVAYEMAATFAKNLVDSGFAQFAEAAAEYNQLRERWCNDNNPPNKGLEIMKHLRERFRNERMTREALEKMALEDGNASLALSKLMQVVQLGDYVVSWAGTVLRSASGAVLPIFIVPPGSLEGPRRKPRHDDIN